MILLYDTKVSVLLCLLFTETIVTIFDLYVLFSEFSESGNRIIESVYHGRVYCFRHQAFSLIRVAVRIVNNLREPFYLYDEPFIEKSKQRHKMALDADLIVKFLTSTVNLAVSRCSVFVSDSNYYYFLILQASDGCIEEDVCGGGWDGGRLHVAVVV